ncbi:MAG: mandelate racemase/muconate lactonizing enzyme family protein [Bacteroidales bacterium]
MNNYSRRNFLGKLIAIPAGLWLSNYHAFSASLKNQVRITAIKALQLTHGDTCLIKIETDAGLNGYGEAGLYADVARANIEHLSNVKGIIGGDPLSIERHFFYMTSIEHPMVPIELISGIDIALWDLAGKILDQPVYKLLGGPFRDGCPMYSHGDELENIMDPASCLKWVEYTKQQPEGFTTFKFSMQMFFTVEQPFHPTVTSSELKKLYQGLANVREAAGDAFDIAIHCHNEFNTASAIAIANTGKPLNVAFIEDPLNVQYSEGWAALKKGTTVPVLAGEKLRTLRQFKPFLDAQAVDIIHPDIAFAGGFTGCMKIADYAAITRTPVALHNVGTLVKTYASAHLSMGIQNFYRSESLLGRKTRFVEQMSTEPVVVRNGILHVPDKPGLGLLIDESYLKSRMAKNESWWG